MPKYKNRKKRIRRKAGKKTNIIPKAIVIILLLIAVAFVAFAFLVNQKTRFVVAKKTLNGGAEVIIVDGVKKEKVIINVPPELSLGLSRSLGVYRLKNAWILGDKEGYGGEVVAESLMKNLFFPVYLWKTDSKDNLSFKQNLLLWATEKNILSYNTTEIDLEKSRFLTKKVLSDGEEGYVVSSVSDDAVLVYFNNSEQTEYIPTIQIIDRTNGTYVSKIISKVVEVAGGKVVGYARENVDNTDCVVSGRDEFFSKSCAALFDCRFEEEIRGSGDVVIIFGESFGKRF